MKAPHSTCRKVLLSEYLARYYYSVFRRWRFYTTQGINY